MQHGRLQKPWLGALASGLKRLTSRVWSGWPEAAYQQPRYRQRLAAVQEHLAQSLDQAPRGALRIISMCAGDGRDVIGALQSHQRRTDVTAWLVELNRQSVSAGFRDAQDAGLQDVVTFLNQDATLYATYKDFVPAAIVLVCGVWGHVPAQERALLVDGIASLCKPGATVIWTRGVSQGMSRFREIETHFSGSRWQQDRLTCTSDSNWAVATYRYCGPPVDLPRNGRLFHFQRRAGRRDVSDCTN